MSGRKNKHKQRGHQREQSSDLLNELNSLRDLLGTDDIGDIPLLDQVASPTKSSAAAAQPPQPRPQPALDEIDLPILFSPVDEELPEDYRSELNESDLKLLRPLQDLPAGRDPEPPAAKRTATQEASKGMSRQEQQQELFAEPPATPVAENPFLPAHIRARLTGGKVPKSEDSPPQPPAADDSVNHAEISAAEPASSQPDVAVSTPPESPKPALPQADLPDIEPTEDSPDANGLSERLRERQQLVDRLVAKQLPELERQLRARIELMLDELEARE